MLTDSFLNVICPSYCTDTSVTIVRSECVYHDSVVIPYIEDFLPICVSADVSESLIRCEGESGSALAVKFFSVLVLRCSSERKTLTKGFLRNVITAISPRGAQLNLLSACAL